MQIGVVPERVRDEDPVQKERIGNESKQEKEMETEMTLNEGIDKLIIKPIQDIDCRWM